MKDWVKMVGVTTVFISLKGGTGGEALWLLLPDGYNNLATNS